MTDAPPATDSAEAPVRIEEEREFPLDAGTLWRLLANTEHLNRTIGLPPVTYGPPINERDGVYREAHAKFFGLLPSKWKEYPFEWVEGERYSVLRVFDSGPLARFLGGVEMSPTPSGTRVKVFCDLTPRGKLGRAFVSIAGPRGVRDTIRYCESFAERARQGDEDPIPRDRTHTACDEDQLEIALRRLRRFPVQPALVDRLARRLREGTDEEVVGMRPYVLADAWKADRHETLRVLLHAAKAGLLHLAWESVCPNCRVPKASQRTLSTLEEKFACDLCAREYAAELDRSVELRLSVSPTIRRARREVYCLGGPYNSPHVLAQRRVPAGGSASVSWPAGPPVRLRSLQSNHVSELVQEEGAPAVVELSYADGGWSGPRLSVATRRPSLVVRNDSPTPLVLVVEHSGSDPRIATAAEVTALQEFRDLFREEVLASGRDVTVEQLTVLFAEVEGTTSLCERLGDAAAFDVVTQALGLLASALKRNRGTLVRTLADAAMAVAPTPALALRAAIEAQEMVRLWSRDRRLDPPVRIRASVHHGPGIAVGANGGIDYFGKTVNVAAALLRHAAGGEVVVSASLASDAGVEGLLSTLSPRVEKARAALPGTDGEMDIVRIIP